MMGRRRHFQHSMAFMTFLINAFFIFLAFDYSAKGFAEAEIPSLFPFSDPGSFFFFDADSSHFKKDGDKQVFEGQVIAIGAGTLIGADRVTIDHTQKTLEATGHVMILNRNQVFTGDTISFNMTSGDFFLTNSMMIVNDEKRTDQIIKKVLGFSKEELAFETKKQNIISKINNRKTELRQQYQLLEKDESRTKDIIDKYSLLLEQEELAKNQENPVLARVGEKQRNHIKRRRTFWEESRKSALAQREPVIDLAYFKLAGDRLERTNNNDYHMKDATFSPCLCDEDESPAWSIRAAEIDTQIGGYADLYDPVVEIKGIPVLYLPYMKLPIKSKRQSGFLMPIFSFNNRSGTIISQPLFIDFGPNSDATITADVFQKRGTKIGTEYRLQQGEFSGWTLRLEGIRDQQWLEERGLREDLRNFYTEGLAEARSNSSRATGKEDNLKNYSGKDFIRRRLEQSEYWRNSSPENAACLNDETSEEACKKRFDKYFSAPENTLRGSASWQGLTILAPRLSFVSKGNILTDHRYNEDLYIPGSVRDVLTSSKNPPYFATSKAKVHLDAKDFYVGASTNYADNVSSA